MSNEAVVAVSLKRGRNSCLKCDGDPEYCGLKWEEKQKLVLELGKKSHLKHLSSKTNKLQLSVEQ